MIPKMHAWNDHVLVKFKNEKMGTKKFSGYVQAYGSFCNRLSLTSKSLNIYNWSDYEVRV